MVLPSRLFADSILVEGVLGALHSNDAGSRDTTALLDVNMGRLWNRGFLRELGNWKGI